MSKILNLGNNAIMFGDPSCPACLAQYKMLSDYSSNQNQDVYINYYDLTKNKVPDFLLDKDGNYVMPTWYLPTSGSSGKLYSGVISDSSKFNTLISKKNKFKFGNSIPEIGTLKKNGKLFPGGNGFTIQNSFENDIQKNWGTGDDTLNAGTLGREFGPGQTNKIYSDNYYNNIRMAVPGGDLDTTLSNNRACNITNNNKAVSMNSGLIYDSKNPQIVGTTSFGMYSKFKKDYDNMLVDKYAGGTNKPFKKIKKVNTNSFIEKAPVYMKTARSAISFGKKKKTVGPGSVLIIKNKKIKIKN